MQKNFFIFQIAAMANPPIVETVETADTVDTVETADTVETEEIEVCTFEKNNLSKFKHFLLAFL